MNPVKEQVNFIITLRAFCVAARRPIFTAPKELEGTPRKHNKSEKKNKKQISGIFLLKD